MLIDKHIFNMNICAHRYEFKSGGMRVYGTKLTIKDLEIHDKGFYKCEASNGDDRVQSTGILLVKPGQWRKFMFLFQITLT